MSELMLKSYTLRPATFLIINWFYVLAKLDIFTVLLLYSNKEICGQCLVRVSLRAAKEVTAKYMNDS
jgi:hypothetical protein